MRSASRSGDDGGGPQSDPAGGAEYPSAVPAAASADGPPVSTASAHSPVVADEMAVQDVSSPNTDAVPRRPRRCQGELAGRRLVDEAARGDEPLHLGHRLTDRRGVGRQRAQPGE